MDHIDQRDHVPRSEDERISRFASAVRHVRDLIEHEGLVVGNDMPPLDDEGETAERNYRPVLPGGGRVALGHTTEFVPAIV